jgi:hypothetical protein
MSRIPLHRLRQHFVPVAAIAAVAATALLSLSLTGVLSTFGASISNATNSVSTGTLQLSEVQNGTTCLSTAAGTSIPATNSSSCGTNNFQGATLLLPGVPIAISPIAMKNTGTSAATALSLTAAACTASISDPQSGGLTGNFCSKVFVTIQEQGTTACVLPLQASTACGTPTSTHTLATLSSAATAINAAWAANATHTFVITLMLDSAADNNYQNITAAQQLTWALVI